MWCTWYFSRQVLSLRNEAFRLFYFRPVLFLSSSYIRPFSWGGVHAFLASVLFYSWIILTGVLFCKEGYRFNTLRCRIPLQHFMLSLFVRRRLWSCSSSSFIFLYSSFFIMRYTAFLFSWFYSVSTLILRTSFLTRRRTEFWYFAVLSGSYVNRICVLSHEEACGFICLVLVRLSYN